MMEGMFGSGSNGQGTQMNSAVSKLIQRKMLEEMFGLKASERPVHAAAQPMGSDPTGSFGILGLRLYAATMTSPVPRLMLESNGRLSIEPEDLRDLASFLQSVSKSFEEKYGEEVEKAKSLEGAELFGAALGLDTESPSPVTGT